jgi:hypothetical protein
MAVAERVLVVSNTTLFLIGIVVSIPTIIVVVALVFAAGEDAREEARLRSDRLSASSSRSIGAHK